MIRITISALFIFRKLWFLRFLRSIRLNTVIITWTYFGCSYFSLTYILRSFWYFYQCVNFNFVPFSIFFKPFYMLDCLFGWDLTERKINLRYYFSIEIKLWELKVTLLLILTDLFNFANKSNSDLIQQNTDDSNIIRQMVLL